MKIIDVETLPISPNPHGVDARKIYDTEHATAVVIKLAPGEALKRHITPVDVFSWVLAEIGIVGIGEERTRVTPDHLVESPAKVPRPNTETRLL